MCEISYTSEKVERGLGLKQCTDKSLKESETRTPNPCQTHLLQVVIRGSDFYLSLFIKEGTKKKKKKKKVVSISPRFSIYSIDMFHVRPLLLPSHFSEDPPGLWL